MGVWCFELCMVQGVVHLSFFLFLFLFFFYRTCRFLSGVESDLRSIALSFLFEAPVSNSFPLLLSNDELLSPSTVSIVPSGLMSWVVRPSPISDSPRSVGSVSWFSYAHIQPTQKKKGIKRRRKNMDDFRDQLEQLCHPPTQRPALVAKFPRPNPSHAQASVFRFRIHGRNAPGRVSLLTISSLSVSGRCAV